MIIIYNLTDSIINKFKRQKRKINKYIFQLIFRRQRYFYINYIAKATSLLNFSSSLNQTLLLNLTVSSQIFKKS